MAVRQAIGIALRIAMRAARAFVCSLSNASRNGPPRTFVRALVLLLIGSAASFAHAAEQRFSVFLDTDSSAATGCVVATSNGPLAGIEQVWTTVVTTTTLGATVTRVERQLCSGATLGAPAVVSGGGWPAGLGNGTLGTAAIETFVPLAALPPGASLKIVVGGTSASGGQDATDAFAVALDAAGPPGVSAPAGIPLSPWLVVLAAGALLALGARRLRAHPHHSTLAAFVVLIAVSGLVWAATVTLDGNVGDWSGLLPKAGNPKGSAPVDANIVAVFVQADGTNLYFRIDADVRVDAAVNAAPVVSAGADQTITLPATASLTGSAADDGLPVPPGTLTTTWSRVSGPGTVAFADANALSTTASFSLPGIYVLRLSASDGALAASDDAQITVNAAGTNRNPLPVNDATSTSPGAGVQLNVLANDSDPDADTLSVISFGQGAHGAVTCTAGGTCTYTPAAGFSGIDTFTYTASDGKGGTASAQVLVDVVAGDTTAGAPALKRGVTTLIGPATTFLYSGSAPIQTGVAPGAITSARASVIRGKVTTRDGSVLPGVTVKVLGHPEFGQTITRANGYFDMAVNGGGPLTVDFSAPAFLSRQKQVSVPWQDYVVVPQVALIGVDSAVTAITPNGATTQFHQSSVIKDADGARRLIVVIPPGTTATMTMSDGSTLSLGTMHVRATEYTVGPNGPIAMPADLPPLSGYTYCVELSVDEAISAGAVSVTFNQPVVTYVENFLGFPVGTNVPVGTYDPAKGIWVPGANGRTIRIVDVAGGVATVDTDGDGIADNALGMSTEERSSLASFYAAGQSLWRVPVEHFSPSDSNWPFTTPDDADAPGDNAAGPDPNESLEDAQCSVGSIIECENQVLGESVPIVGTPFTLNYRSDRVPGHTASRTIRLSGPSVPASLASIDVHLSVAGRDFAQTFPPGPNQQTTFTWDRNDAYGRPMLGGQTLSVRIDYNYPTTYRDPGPMPAAFASVGGVALSANPGRSQIAISQSFTTTIGEGLTDARTLGLGGWTLDAHHLYDPNARVAHFGGGARRRAGSLARMLTTIDLPGRSQLFDVEAAPDGSALVAFPHGDVIVRVAPGGSQSIVAGTGVEGFSGDGGPATAAQLGDPTGIALAPDGTLYIAEEANFRVRKVAPDGTISTVAGTGVPGFSGDLGAATLAQLSFAERIAVASDSSLLILDGQRVRRVGNDGIINTVAGNGLVGFSGDGGPATNASLNAASISAAPDGGFYVADFNNHRVRRVGPDGVINTVADYSAQNGQPVSVRPTRDGGLLIGLQFVGGRTPQVDLLRSDGKTVTIAGGGPSPIVENIPATQAALTAMRGVALAPDGSLFIAPGDGGSRLLRVSPALPGFDGTAYLIASPDGSVLYLFDSEGKHLRTVNALTGGVLFEFGYDVEGRLASVTEKTGATDNVTTIEHDAGGSPTAIVGPFGQRTVLTVGASGFLTSIANPAGDVTRIASDAAGLVSSFTDARGKTSTFVFDADGLLTHDADAVSGSQSLSRSTVADHFTVTRTTALARTTRYETQNAAGNRQLRTLTGPDGLAEQSDEAIDAGTVHTLAPDGTVSDRIRGPDPRFGMQAPVEKSFTVNLPSGLVAAGSRSVTAALSNPLDPLSLTTLTATTTLAGFTSSSIFDAATNTIASTSAEGRASTVTIDALGRTVSRSVSGFNPTNIAYDSRGRIASITRGSGPSVRTFTFGYGADGFVESITDPIGRAAHFAYDAAGRLTAKTFADGSVARFAYDAAGNLTTVTPPGRSAYAMTYSDRNELALFTPPALPGSGPTGYAYDADREPTTVTRPDGLTIGLSYDAAGRLATRIASGGASPVTHVFGYDSVGRLASVAGDDGVTVAYGYDGPLGTGETWTGPVGGGVTRTYDATLAVASQAVTGGSTIAFGYDRDGLPVQAGELTIARNAANGFPAGSTLRNVTTGLAFNAFGEFVSFTASLGASEIYSNAVTRDGIGRITRRTEAIGGSSDVYDYTYAVSGQLTSVSKNAVPVESYGYDANGNRTTATVDGVSVTGVYDGVDRLQAYGAATYTYSAAGELLTKVVGPQTTQYRYDPLGNLRAATLPDGTAITYVIDGSNRRIGKRIGASLVKAFLYSGTRRIVAELDGTGAIVSQFVYGDGARPAYMIKAGNVFRIVTDHVGSVRLVVNASTGAVAQRMDYDSFGSVVADTNPGFQPFGFASGLYDADTKLVHFGARDYDPETGRWTSADPIGFAGGDTNLYRYVNNDPVNSTDRSGTADPPPTDAELLSYLREVQRNVEKAYKKLEKAVKAGETEALRENPARASSYLNELRDWAKAEIKTAGAGVEARYARGIGGKISCGGELLSYAGLALQALDVIEEYQRALENNRTIWEQEDVEQDEARGRGVHKLISCIGTICVVKDLDYY